MWLHKCIHTYIHTYIIYVIGSSSDEGKEGKGSYVVTQMYTYIHTYIHNLRNRFK
jgi:hypothetical protein